MRKILLPAALLVLGVSLSACSTTFITPAYTLTVNLSGVTTANVQVYDMTENTALYAVAVTGSKTFAALPGRHAYRVTGSPVVGYTVGSSQSVTLNSAQAVTLTYTAN